MFYGSYQLFFEKKPGCSQLVLLATVPTKLPPHSHLHGMAATQIPMDLRHHGMAVTQVPIGLCLHGTAVTQVPMGQRLHGTRATQVPPGSHPYGTAATQVLQALATVFTQPKVTGVSPMENNSKQVTI